MADDPEMSFLEHLEELRWHVVRSLIAIVVLMVIAFANSQWLFTNVIYAPAQIDFVTFRWLCNLADLTGFELCIEKLPFTLQSRQLMGQFNMSIIIALVVGLVVAFPYVFWEIWSFIRPGLHQQERRGTRGAVGAVTFLFLSGVSFGYFIMTPISVWFLSNYTLAEQIINEFDITSYVNTIALLVLGSGLLFQMPVIVFFLTKAGIITPSTLRAARKTAIIVILIVSAIITPPDPLSLCLIALPLYVLYELSIFISIIEVRRVEKRDREMNY